MSGPPAAGGRGTVVVVAPGSLTTVQDAGRPGLAHLGVAPSGALDRPAWALANRLVGNPFGAAALETTLTGPTLRFAGPARHVALTGAPAPLRLDGRPVALYAPVAVRPGQTLQVGTAPLGLRSYLAVAGGFDVAGELGSASTDLLGGLGPAPLAAGDVVALGPVPSRPPAAVDVAPPPGFPATVTVAVTPGPRHDRLGDRAAALLATATWSVAASSNRVGVRLDGPALALRPAGDGAPEAMVTGAVQVPPSGTPIIFLADHPVTGGYPVVAVVDDAALPGLAQARPGTLIRFAVGAPTVR